MIGRLAVRSLTAHPVRSAVLAAGFGVGVGVMAILLGVAEVVLEQSRAPALVGGGDVLIRLGPYVPGQLVLAGPLQSDAIRPRIRVASPSHSSTLYLLHEGRTTRVRARGGIPSLERAIGDRETATVAAWHDSPDDTAWTQNTPEKLLRHLDRFSGIPDAPEWASSWAEWLYFNGRSPHARFYLTFIVGPMSDLPYFEQAVRPHLGRDVEYAGHLLVPELSTLVGSSAAVLVTPLWDEPYGLVVAEALASGTPVVAFERGGIPEVIADPSVGRLVRPGDVQAMADATSAVVGLDRVAVREYAERYLSVDRMVTAYERAYRRLASGSIAEADRTA